MDNQFNTSLFDGTSFKKVLPGKVELSILLSKHVGNNSEEYEMKVTVINNPTGAQVRFWMETNIKATDPKWKRAARIKSSASDSKGHEIFKQIILFDKVKNTTRAVKTASGIKFLILEKNGNLSTGNIAVIVDGDQSRFVDEITKTSTTSNKNGEIYFGKFLEENYMGQCMDWRHPFFGLSIDSLPAWNSSFDVVEEPNFSALMDDEVIITMMSWVRGMAWGKIKDGSFCRIYLFTEMNSDSFRKGGIYKFGEKITPIQKSNCKYELVDIELV